MKAVHQHFPLEAFFRPNQTYSMFFVCVSVVFRAYFLSVSNAFGLGHTYSKLVFIVSSWLCECCFGTLKGEMWLVLRFYNSLLHTAYTIAFTAAQCVLAESTHTHTHFFVAFMACTKQAALTRQACANADRKDESNACRLHWTQRMRRTQLRRLSRHQTEILIQLKCNYHV